MTRLDGWARRASRTLRAGAALSLLAGLLSACASDPPSDLRPGDCIDYSALDEVVVSVPPVDCSQPHEAEVYHVFEITGLGRDFDEEAVARRADQGCRAAFEEYVGTPYLESELYSNHFSPLREGWEAGDRTVVCFLFPEQGALTGSVQGSGR